MSAKRQFDTVAYDVRDDTSMLFFAKTSAAGDIDDYLLIMRAEGEDFEDGVYLEINEHLLAGHDLIRAARMTANVLVLSLHQPAAALDGATEIVLSYDDTEQNRQSIESGAFRVLGNLLEGGHA